ncbi:SOS response-associated peptidase [Halovulum dunhuangense]|uniref:Abasic site processing protein n=1 Tax=Halovulum dunhuangense TaxID=1505036 RepID=A0A849L145_9RHOB|nr:SOS response-associated peptidase [Halovulum dunhuangense]NNU79981.1 SOS response-associated peptidase [Halovulum dunhuangense]
MCGRFTLTAPVAALETLFEAEAGDVTDMPRHNICPTQDIAVVVAHAGARHIVPMRWGFIPRWYKTPSDGPLLINARSETIAGKPAFRDACRTRRCLIPASGFYEWTATAGKGKEPWYIHPAAPDDGVIAFAGVWQSWTAPEGKRLVTAAIVTTAANESLAPVHHRMPVIVAPEDWALWLGEAGKGAATLMRPAPEDLLTRHRVSTRVNGMKAEDPELIAPLPATA